MYKHTMTISQCAKELHISESLLRKGLQQDKFPFGVAIQTTKNRYTYWISADKVSAYIHGMESET